MSMRSEPDNHRLWTLHACRSVIRPVIVVLLAWNGLQVWTDSALAQSLHFTRLKSTTSTYAQAQSSVQKELRTKGFFSPFMANAGTRMARTVYPTMTLDSTSIGKYYYAHLRVDNNNWTSISQETLTSFIKAYSRHPFIYLLLGLGSWKRVQTLVL